MSFSAIIDGPLTQAPDAIIDGPLNQAPSFDAIIDGLPTQAPTGIIEAISKQWPLFNPSSPPALRSEVSQWWQDWNMLILGGGVLGVILLCILICTGLFVWFCCSKRGKKVERRNYQMDEFPVRWANQPYYDPAQNHNEPSRLPTSPTLIISDVATNGTPSSKSFPKKITSSGTFWTNRFEKNPYDKVTIYDKTGDEDV